MRPLSYKDNLASFTVTGQQIRYENGNVFNIHSKITKSGERFYRWSSRSHRHFPVSRQTIEELLIK